MLQRVHASLQLQPSTRYADTAVRGFEPRLLHAWSSLHSHIPPVAQARCKGCNYRRAEVGSHGRSHGLRKPQFPFYTVSAQGDGLAGAAAHVVDGLKDAAAAGVAKAKEAADVAKAHLLPLPAEGGTTPKPVLALNRTLTPTMVQA